MMHIMLKTKKDRITKNWSDYEIILDGFFISLILFFFLLKLSFQCLYNEKEPRSASGLMTKIKSHQVGRKHY